MPLFSIATSGAWRNEECEIDVSRDPNRVFLEDRTGPFYIAGQRIRVEVPFQGDRELFFCRPGTFSLNPPSARIDKDAVVLTWEMPHDAGKNLRPEIDRAIQSIEQYLGTIRSEVKSFNDVLPDEATKAIEARRSRLLANQGRLASLGIPVKERSGAPKTYAIPSARCKAAPVLPPATTTAYEPEPVWEMSH